MEDIEEFVDIAIQARDRANRRLEGSGQGQSRQRIYQVMN